MKQIFDDVSDLTRDDWRRVRKYAMAESAYLFLVLMAGDCVTAAFGRIFSLVFGTGILFLIIIVVWAIAGEVYAVMAGLQGRGPPGDPVLRGRWFFTPVKLTVLAISHVVFVYAFWYAVTIWIPGEGP